MRFPLQASVVHDESFTFLLISHCMDLDLNDQKRGFILCDAVVNYKESSFFRLESGQKTNCLELHNHSMFMPHFHSFDDVEADG